MLYNLNMIINHKKKIIFISVPKTASTSIMMFLDENSVHEKPHIYHQTINELLVNRADDKILTYKIIAVNRDPVARLISVYTDSILDKNHITLGFISKFKNFNEFCKSLYKDKQYMHVRHLMPQQEFIKCNSFNNLNIKVYRYEKLLDLKIYLKKIFPENQKEIGHYRETKSKRNALVDIINTKSLIYIYKIYSEDYKKNPTYFINFIFYLLITMISNSILFKIYPIKKIIKKFYL